MAPYPTLHNLLCLLFSHSCLKTQGPLLLGPTTHQEPLPIDVFGHNKIPLVVLFFFIMGINPTNESLQLDHMLVVFFFHGAPRLMKLFNVLFSWPPLLSCNCNGFSIISSIIFFSSMCNKTLAPLVLLAS